MENSKAAAKESPLILRPHHGMCFQFYEGMGYSEEFTDHMGHIVKHLADNPQTRIILRVRTDCVCENCPNKSADVCTSPDKVAGYDNAVLQKCVLKDGDILTFQHFTDLIRKNILDKNLRREICGDCTWNDICDGSLDL